MKATLTLDGVDIIIGTTKGNDISLILLGEMNESVLLSPSSVQLIAAAFYAALAELEESE